MATRKITPAERAKIKKEQYKDRAKRMRVLFRGKFDAKAGFDLRSPDKWTPAQKAKVTKYFRVVAPRLTGNFVVKRYRKPEHLRAAIGASLQEKLLPGQTAAAFSFDKGERIQVIIKKEKATVKRGTVDSVNIMFDKIAFLKDPNAEIDRVLAATNNNVFQIVVGAQKQNKVLTRAEVKDEIFLLIARYRPSVVNRRQGQRTFDEWLNGIVAYAGEEKRTLSAVERALEKHQMTMVQKRKDHLDGLAASRQNVSVKTLRTRRTKRAKAKGRL